MKNVLICCVFMFFVAHQCHCFTMQECFYALHHQFPGSARIRWLHGLILEASNR